MARRPGGDQSPAPRSVSNRRHGAPAPPSPSMMAAPRSRAAWLRFRAPPVDRQHPAAHSRNPAPASTRPVDARIGPVRLASARRPASEPPSIRPHTPNRRLGALLWPAQPGSDPFGRRSAACRPPISVRSGAIRPSTRPWAVHVAASPPAGSRSSCPAAAYADPSGTPGTPTPAPRSVPGGGRDARAHICPRVRRGNFQKKSERGTIWRPGRGAGFISGQEQACTGLPWVGAGRQPASRGWDGRALRPATAAAPGRSRHADFR